METFKVLVAGGSGFLGSNLVKKLAKTHDVLVVDIAQQQNIMLQRESNVSFIKLDISFFKNLEKLPKVDVVYNLGSPASVLSFNDDNYVSLSNSTFSSFISMLNWCKKNGIEKYIFPSSGTVYGSSSNAKNRSLSPITIYGALKLTHEALAYLYREDFDVSGLRIFMGYGPGEERKGKIASPVFQFLSDVIEGRAPTIWGDGSQTRDLIFIDDVVDVMIHSLHLSGLNFFDVGTGINTSFNDIIKIISKITQKKVNVQRVPKPKSYVKDTSADPKFLKSLIKKNLIGAEEGISKFYNYLLTKIY